MTFGIETNHHNIEEKVFISNLEHQDIYQENFRKFNKIHQALKDL